MDIEEIIMDILSRLPVKSLLRFKQVSKFWNILISQPYFKKMHLNFHVNNHNSPKKLLLSQNIKRTTFNFYSSTLSNLYPELVKDIRRLYSPSISRPKYVRVYCCYDGLFLIGIWSEHDKTNNPLILLLWNPSTGESVKLPTQYPQVPPNQYIYGLGYDSTTDDYKIIRVDRFADSQKNKVGDEILALKSGSWRKISKYAGGKKGSYIRLRELCLAFVEGAFHWVSSRGRVVSVNISNEMYGDIPWPKAEWSNRIKTRGVSAVGGRLCFHEDDSIIFNLWILKDHYGVKESWTKWFTLPTDGRGIMTPIYKFSNDEVLLSCYSLKVNERYIYKTSNGSSNLKWPLHSNDNIIDSVTIDDGFVYTETLISPKLGSGLMMH